MSGQTPGRRPNSHRNETLSADPDFDCLSERELQELSSDDLITQIRDATDAGRPDCAKAALAILCYRHLDDVERRISIRVPRQDVEDVAMTVMFAALQSTFDGTSIGEFVNWLHRIVDRRGIADYWRGKEREPETAPIAEEHSDEDEVWGEQVSEQDETEAIAVQSVIDECLEPLSDPHREVVEHNVFEGLDANETADQVNEDHPELEPPMSQANVHKIVSRFRECVRKRLADRDPDLDHDPDPG